MAYFIVFIIKAILFLVFVFVLITFLVILLFPGYIKYKYFGKKEQDEETKNNKEGDVSISSRKNDDNNLTDYEEVE